MTSKKDNQQQLEKRITENFKVPEPKSEEVKEAPATETQRILLNQTDAYINDRIKSQPQTLDEVEVIPEENKPTNTNQLTLPKELDEYKERLRFRWLSKDKRQIDRACDVRGWVIANRTHFPDLPDHLFTVSGSIERGDNILSFIKKEIGDKMFEAPAKQSKEIVESTLNARS